MPYVQPTQPQPGLPQDPAASMMMTPQQTPPTPADISPPEGGGTSGNANLPGNDQPQEGAGDVGGNSLTTKPRQTPSGGQQQTPMMPGMVPGMNDPGLGMVPPGQPATQPSTQPAAAQPAGGADMMTQQSMPKGMSYARKERAMVAEILAANPGLPRERAVVIARRALALPGVVAADDNPNDLNAPLMRPDGQSADQGGGSGGGSGSGSGGGGTSMPGLPGMGGAAEAGAAGGEAAGLAELLPLALI